MEYDDSYVEISHSKIHNHIAKTYINANSVHVVDHGPTEDGASGMAPRRSKGKSGKKTGEEMLAEVQEKLPSLNFLQSHEEASRKIIGESGQWFLGTEKFQDWKSGKLAAFLGLGDPGVGKTCLVSLVISHLQGLHGSTRVPYLYMNHQEAESQTPANIISTLLKQLLSTYSSLPSSALSLYEQVNLDQGPPQMKVLVMTLIALCKDANYKTYIVIDALDECKFSYQPDLVYVLEQLLANQVYLFATSRPSSEDIESLFDTAHSIRYIIRATDSDISSFLKQKLERKKSLKGILDEKFKNEAIDTIISRSQGVFLIAAMQIDQILSLTNKSKMKEVLSKFPSDLETNFSRTLQRIEAQTSELSNIAKLTMIWLIHAQQPFTVKALCYALGTKVGSNRFEVDNLTTSGIILESCCGLV
ncbi:hypothetical protein BDN72DRAFT_804611, partial [Pluteus cervinus]